MMYMWVVLYVDYDSIFIIYFIKIFYIKKYFKSIIELFVIGIRIRYHTAKYVKINIV